MGVATCELTQGGCDGRQGVLCERAIRGEGGHGRGQVEGDPQVAGLPVQQDARGVETLQVVKSSSLPRVML